MSLFPSVLCCLLFAQAFGGFTITDELSQAGETSEGDICTMICPRNKGFEKFDDSDRCVMEVDWGTYYCKLCGAQGEDEIDPTGETIRRWCPPVYCENAIRIVDDNVMPQRGKGAIFGFDEECADRFFQAQFGSTNWDREMIDFSLNNGVGLADFPTEEEKVNNLMSVHLWKNAKSCGNLPCGRLSKSISKAGDFKVGDFLFKVPVKKFYDWRCEGTLKVMNIFPGLYKKQGMYFSFENDCMDKFYGNSNWDKKVMKNLSKHTDAEHSFDLKFFKNASACGGLSCARITPPSQIEKGYWKYADQITRNKDCVGHYEECGEDCLKEWVVDEGKQGNGFCAHDNLERLACESGEGECAISCGCDGENDLFKWVCGADGNTYENQCAAECAGTTVESEEPCQCVFRPGVKSDGLGEEEEEEESEYGGLGYGNYGSLDCEESYAWTCKDGEVCHDNYCAVCPGSYTGCPEGKEPLTKEECQIKTDERIGGQLSLVNAMTQQTGCSHVDNYFTYNTHPKGGPVRPPDGEGADDPPIPICKDIGSVVKPTEPPQGSKPISVVVKTGGNPRGMSWYIKNKDTNELLCVGPSGYDQRNHLENPETCYIPEDAENVVIICISDEDLEHGESYHEDNGEGWDGGYIELDGLKYCNRPFDNWWLQTSLTDGVKESESAAGSENISVTNMSMVAGLSLFSAFLGYTFAQARSNKASYYESL